MRIKCHFTVGGRSVLGQYLIDMERIDSPLLCIAYIDNISLQIPRQTQKLGFRV